MFVTIRKERNVLPQVLPRDLAADYQQEYASRIVAVKLDNTLHDLQTPVGKSRSIEFVELESEEGWIIYRRSVEFLLVMAVHELYPEAEVAAMFRANNGLYCEISVPGKKLTEAMAQAIEAEMRRIVEEDRPIVKEVLEREAAVKLFKETKQVEKANLIASLKLPKVSIYRCGDYYDYLYGAMIGSTGHLGKFALDIFESGVLLRTPDLKSKGEVPPSVPQPKLSEVLTEAKNWANILRCRYVTDLNRAIRSGRISEVIRVSEALQEKHIAEIADYIAKHRQKLRLILIAGPSSSGKTSFAQRLRVQLQVMGLRPFSISLDNYFVNREDTPKTPAGAYDYECLEALDVDLFNKDMFALLKGESVVLPRYNFKTGEREWEGQTPLTLEKSQPIIVEGIHGLNEKLTAAIPREYKFKIYVSALTQLNIDAHNRIPTTDARLIRRLVRDYQFRGASALKTLKQWPDVRQGEEKYIFPYQEEADVMFNSAMIYELSALRRYAVPMLEAVTPDVPEYTKARRLLDFCQYFLDLPDEEDVPNNSILREFIGKSVFFKGEDQV
ncbi:nucleoside kinase [Mitsuokella multacida]|uniref:Phosphoribulokinase/uridine kinase family protein n=1 Tax=Mitsuokella multacida DSM 20544 TaxID=500635 RepID=C9KIU7_9FIRM|nr:nucleoside kinase [Mitsuokella multacida]EEX70210.1 phosphoribulokinase/uridine kinase family protein [Mitsuokella multacida DSM 20544]